VLPSGKKAYYVRLRDQHGKDRRLRLGATTEISFDEASRLARDHLAGPAGAPGRPPRGARNMAIQPDRAVRSPSFRDFAARLLREHATIRLKPCTLKDYRHMVKRYLVPVFGTMPLDSIDNVDVTRFHASLAETRSTANAKLQPLRSIYSKAIAWRVLEHSFTPPTRGVPRFPRRRRERFLDPRERAKLDRLLDQALERKPNERGHLSWHAIAAIRLLAMTGMRRDELLDLTCDMVDTRHRCFRLPDWRATLRHGDRQGPGRLPSPQQSRAPPPHRAAATDGPELVRPLQPEYGSSATELSAPQAHRAQHTHSQDWTPAPYQSHRLDERSDRAASQASDLTLGLPLAGQDS